MNFIKNPYINTSLVDFHESRHTYRTNDSLSNDILKEWNVDFTPFQLTDLKNSSAMSSLTKVDLYFKFFFLTFFLLARIKTSLEFYTEVPGWPQRPKVWAPKLSFSFCIVIWMVEAKNYSYKKWRATNNSSFKKIST